MIEMLPSRFNLPQSGILRAKNGAVWVSPITETVVPGLLPVVAISCHGCDAIPTNLSPSECAGNFVQA